MKVSPRAKKFAAPHPHVATLIADILATPTEGLVEFLSDIDSWRWPRSDLNAWIKVLDKFDSILEDVIRDFDIDNLQEKAFPPEVKHLVCGILKFERLLLENSTNRKLYQSYDRLNSFLSCSDLDVLVACLLLLLRPSQQYTGQHGLSQTLQVSSDRLESLAKSWPALREHGIEMLSLVDDKSDEHLERLPQETSEVHFTFYRTEDGPSENQGSTATSTAEGSSKAQSSASSSAPYTIHLGPLAQSSRSSQEIFVDAVRHHNVPEKHKFDLLCRIRTAHALGSGRQTERQNLTMARLLSIAIYAHTHSEAQTQSTMYLFEPDLSNRIAEVLQLDRGVSPHVQMTALSALDALVRYRGKGQEVLTAVNAGVNHGVLMSLFRKSVAEISNPASTLPNLFIDALLSFVGLIAQYTSGGSSLIVGAGLIPLLIQIISITLPERVSFVSKSMSIVDHVLYAYPNAFTMFCNGHGVDALTERIKQEIDLGVETYGADEKAKSATSSYGLLQHGRSGLLKHILRSMHKMMQNSGMTEGMRGLIDSSLLKSVEKVIIYRGIFGPSIMPIAINIVATFLHNEPTSFSAIQEAKMPERVYDSIEFGIEPSMEVIQAFTNVIGALGLNQAGQEQLSHRPAIIPSLFTIFTSERHLKVLQEKENAMLIGTYFDELVRHHPSLKDAVFSSVMSSLDKIIALGRDFTPPDSDRSWYSLVDTNVVPSSEDVLMGEAENGTDSSAAMESHPNAEQSSGPVDDSNANKQLENPIMDFINVMSHFLNGLFHQASSLQVPGLCGDFIELGGLSRLTDLLELPCLPYTFAAPQHLEPFATLIRIISDVSPRDMLDHVSGRVKRTLDATKPFWESIGENSRFEALVDSSSDKDSLEANFMFRNMITMHIQISLLSDIYNAIGFAHSRSAIGLLHSMTGNGAIEILPSLGALHRAFIWESIMFKNALRARGIQPSASGSQTPREGAIVSPIIVQNGSAGPSDAHEASEAVEAEQKEPANETPSHDNSNAKALAFLATQIPNAISPVLLAIAKMLMFGRRGIDISQRKEFVTVAETLATVMHDHLKEFSFNDGLAGYAYNTLMLTFISVMLFDDSNNQNPLNTVLLIQFRKQGGVDAVIASSRRYADAISRINAISPADRSDEENQEIVHATGGFKVALHLLHSLISFKPTLDVHQMGSLSSVTRSETETDLYEPFDFLVKMRLSIAPVILETWQSSWLVSAPPALSRSVLMSVRELLAAENEQKPAANSAEPVPNPVRTPAAPTEDQIRQITDMGFRRGAALHALERARNNVPLATEYLLSVPVGALDDIPEPPENSEPNDAEPSVPEPTQDESTAETPSDTNPTDVPEPETAEDHPMEESIAEPTAEDRRRELDDLREQLQESFGSRALRLADAQPADLVFDVRHLFSGPLEGYREEAILTVLGDIEKFSPAALDVQEVPLSVRCRLLALSLSSNAKSILSAAEEKTINLMGVLQALLLSNPIGHDAEQSLPKWLAPLFLAAELLLIAADDIRPIALPLPGEEVVQEQLLCGPSSKESRPVLLDVCVRLLNLTSLPMSEGLAVTSMLVQLTRDRDSAKAFVERGGLSRLLVLLRGPSDFSSSSAFQTHVIMIFRHLMENQATVEAIMRCEIKRWFSSPRNRAFDVNTFARGNGDMLVRDPQAFINVTKSLCQLVQPDSGMSTLMLKPETKEAEQTSTAPEESSSLEKDVEMHSDQALSSLLTDESTLPTEPIIHGILDELTKIGTYPADVTQAITESESESVTSPVAPDPSIQDGKLESSQSQSQDNHFYACLLMTYLAELLISYDRCKSAFLSYPKKKPILTPGKESGKSRSAALSFILSEFVTYGNFITDVKTSSIRKQRMAMSECAMQLIVAVCVDNSAHSTSSTDFSTIRKLVLDCISKALRETSSMESTGDRYGRLQALGELCHRLLTVRFNNGQKGTEEACMQIAKIMLEKNFVASLTTVVSEIDLKFPNVKNLVSGLLRPLEHLTKVAIKMGRPSNQKDKAPSSSKSETSSSTSDDDMDDDAMDIGENRETPDLYRNSALGMYSGEMEDVNFDANDEMDEDEDIDDEDDVDVDFDGEGSVDTSNTDEDEDVVEGEDIVVATAEAVDGWQGEDDEMDEDDEDEEDDDDEAEEDEEDEEDADEEMTWQDGGAEGTAGPGRAGDDEDDDLDDDALDAMEQAAEEIEQEVLSEQDMAEDIGEFDEVGFDEADPEDDFEYNANGHRGGSTRRGFIFGGGLSGRTRGDEQEGQLFGRGRPSTAESMMHPLLVDAHSSGAAAPQHIRAIQRRMQRGVIGGNAFADMLQTIGDLVGGGAAQFMQRLVTTVGAGGAITADIHVQMPPSNGLLVDERPRQVRGIPTPVRIQTIRSTDARSQNAPFVPLLTLQRWSEEAGATLQKHVQERAGRASNHISCALLPEARENARVAKEKAEKERAAAEELRKKTEEQAQAEVQAAEEARRKEEEAEKAKEDEISTSQPEQQTPVGESEPPAEAAPDESAAPESVIDESMAVEAVASTSEDAPTHDDVQMGEVSSSEIETAEPEEDNRGEGSSAATAERVTVLIHGNPVDITDTGIDPTFLEALPDDMREEVINQHFREQRTVQAEQVDDSSISADFLDALPPEIRAELLQQERLERNRRQTQEVQGAAVGPADIDPASFIASLDPQLRQSVLMESDEGFLQTLPSHMIAEAGSYYEHVQQALPRREATQPRVEAVQPTRKLPQIRDAVQLLDKAGVASILRLLFFPQLSRKNLLLKVFVNLCENSKSRTDLFNLLLNILQDGTGDLATVDKNFAQLSFRPVKGSPQTPKSAAKHKESSALVPSTSQVTSDIAPDLVAQRCLDALSYIVETNESSSLFFLTEHELPAGMRRTTSRKGKGKEKQIPQSHYPVVLLLGLLDRQTLLKTPSIVDAVAGLLDTITRPLSSLKPSEKKSQDLAQQAPSNAVTTEPSTQTGHTNTSAEAGGPTTEVITQDQPKVDSVGAVEEKILLANPPQIPHHALRLIVNILTVGDCSGKTFHHTLALIHHLSFLPDARDVIAQELKSRAQEFGHNISSDLDSLVTALHVHDGRDELPNALASKFSPASSDQAKLLRILKTIDYMYTKSASLTAQAGEDTSQTNGAKEIYDSFRFTPLWNKLGDCLAVVENKPDIEHIATILLPLIESLMVVCKNVGLKSAPTRLSIAPGSPRSPLTVEESIDNLFVSFTDDHRKVLNLMVRNNPSLMSGSFSLLVQNSRVLDFDNKRNYFTQQLHRRPHSREHYGTIQLNIRRARMFEDSYHAFLNKTGDQIKYGKLSVRFYQEEGVDAGGVTREWFQVLARQMFNPNYALFEPCAADRQTYQPNKASKINPDHLFYFKFVGRVIGKAIYDGRLMDAHFARSLYRQLLGKPVDYRDVEWVDPEYYNSLCWILENDPTPLELTFIAEVEEFGQRRTIPLKENGASIPVTIENRKEYVQLSARYRLHLSIQEQIEHLLSGFYEIIPKELISIFNEQEVELLISGTPDIDVDEWRAATEYTGYTSADPVIVWWWRALKSFNRDEKAKVLSFATGTSRVPLGGFVDLQGVQGVQRFSIHRAYGDPDRLPQAHTCFNQIDLPQYSSYEKLRQQLLLAINEGGEGFGFA